MTASAKASEPTRSGLCDIGGVALHYEVRGQGPALLFVPGASGDGSSFDLVTGALAAYYSVITYDRRGRSRSSRPDNWSTTSVDEQADDAAALLIALGLAPAHVFGTSSGATIGLNLALRHPDVVRRAVLHELPKIGVLPDRDRLRDELRARMAAVRAKSGHRAAMADFLGWLSGPQATPPDARAKQAMDRILDSGDVWLDYELGVVDRYDPPEDLARNAGVPIVISVGSEGGTALHQQLLQSYAESLGKLAAGVGGRLVRMPGAHIPYRTHPDQFIDQLRSLLD